jgi:hypothetical protein
LGNWSCADAGMAASVADSAKNAMNKDRAIWVSNQGSGDQGSAIRDQRSRMAGSDS